MGHTFGVNKSSYAHASSCVHKSFSCTCAYMRVQKLKMLMRQHTCTQALRTAHEQMKSMRDHLISSVDAANTERQAEVRSFIYNLCLLSL